MFFLSPWFLPALAAVAAPVILHLLNRRKRRTVNWAAMRFLMSTDAPQRKPRVRLKELLLLLLRMAAVAALVLFFAKPLLPAGLTPAGERDVILVLDGSLSVSQTTDSGSAWKESLAKAQGALEELHSGDFVRILLAAEAPQWLTASALEADSAGKAQAAAILKAAAPGQGGCRLTESLAEAVAARPAREGLTRRVVMFSDFQAQSVKADAAAAWTAVQDSATVWPGGCVLEAVASGPETTPPNLAVLRAEASREQAAPGEVLLFSARVKNTGPAETFPASLRWMIGGAPSGLSTVPPLPPGEEATVEFSYPCPPQPGTVLVSCELEAPADDVLTGDNAASVLVETVEPAGVLLVDGSGSADAAVTDTAWIEAALGTGAGEENTEPSPFKLTVTEAEQFSPETIAANRVIILANPPLLPEPVLAALEDFVRKGGGLWLLPGDRTEQAGPGFAEAFHLRGAGLSPLRWTAAQGDPADAEKALKLRLPAEAHPVTRFLQDPRRSDFSSVRIRRRFLFDSPAPLETQVLITLDNGSPFLAERRAGEGRVMVQAAPFNLAWADWPRHHSFVVLLHEGLWRLASSGVVRRNLAAGETLSWPAPPELTEESLPLRRPDGQYSTVKRGQGRTMVSPDTLQPGLYIIEAKGAASGGTQFLVRRGEEESDLRPASQEERERIQAAAGLQFTAEPLQRNPAVENVESRRPAWPLLAAAGAAFLCLESLLATFVLWRRQHQSGLTGAVAGGAFLKTAAELREGFTWDSPVPLPWLTAAAAAVILWLAVLAFAEWKMAKRPRLAPFLWLLRAAAVVALALALAGPSKTLTRRETTRQAVSILVDSSASMTLTDPDTEVPGWSSGGPDDAAFGQLTAARHHLRRLSVMPPGQWATPAGEQRWADAAAVLQKAADGNAPEDLRQAAGRFAETAAAFTSGQSVLARDCLRVIAEAEAAAADRMKSLEPAAAAAPPGSSAGRAESRLKRTADWLAAAESGWLRECREEFDVTVFDAGEVMVPAVDGTFGKWRAAGGSASPQHTDLAAVLDGAAREAGSGRTRAIVLVTDGGHNAKRSAEEAAERLRGLPLLLVPAGAAGGAVEKDLSLPSLLAPATVYKNDALRIEAVVSAAGCEGETVEAVLKEGDRKIESKMFRIRDGAPETPLEFLWKPERTGRHQLQVELSVLKDEITADNNRQELIVEVLEDTLRLLIADREPRWETRYLLNLMKRDMRMEFDTMLFAPLYNPETASDTPPPVFPFDLDGWAQYRIVILGDVTPEQLTPEQQTLLVKYVVDRGGTLILVAGDQAMPAAYETQPLGKLIPVTRAPYPQGEAYSIALSMEGRGMDPGRLADTPEESDRIWREATGRLPVHDLSQYSRAKPQARVLLQAFPAGRAEPPPGRAFLTWQDAGKGRVIYLAAPVTWHLRYLSGDKWHYRFWGQLLQWAVSRTMSGGSRTVHLAADRTRVPQDAPLHLILRLEDLLGKPVANAECRAVIRTGSGTGKSVPFTADEKVPGSYRALLTGLPAGPQRIGVEGAEIDRLLKEEGREGKIDTLVNIDPPENRELREVFCDMNRMRRLATAADGAVLPPGAVAEALKNLGLRPSVVEQTALTPVWNEWPWLGLILGFLTIEWILRKPAGLV